MKQALTNSSTARPPQGVPPELQHRPTDPAALAREARRLVRTGLTAGDVARALGLSPHAVAQLLQEDAA